MAELGRKTKRYPSDLTDEEWARIEPMLPKPSRRGRKPEVDLREVLNAIRYMARSAGGWRMLPVHFGPWQTVYWWFRRFVRRLLFLNCTRFLWTPICPRRDRNDDVQHEADRSSFGR
jgi:putative transposase